MTIDILPEPKLKDGIVLADPRVRPRSLHFYKGTQCLIASYLNHGVMYAPYLILVMSLADILSVVTI